jgi:aspartate/methionine/tyrosine aminotransferase
VDQGSNWYAPSEGLPELRAEIAAKEKRVNGFDISADDVIVTQGISEGIQFLMGAIVNPGDEILLPGPSYPPYVAYAKFFGGEPVSYRTIESEGWTADPGDVEAKITPRTKAIVIVNPNNPTGAAYDEKTISKIGGIARDHGLLLVADEIYDQLVFDRPPAAVARIVSDYPVVGLNGFSKAYLMTGWRLGYMYFRDVDGKLNDLKDAVAKQSRIRLCASTPVQKAALAALKGPSDHIKELVNKVRTRARLAAKRLNDTPGLSCSEPAGAFYVFPRIENSKWADDKQFALDLLKATGVLVVHGSGFDETYGSAHFRVVVLPPESQLEEALGRIRSFMKAG